MLAHRPYPNPTARSWSDDIRQPEPLTQKLPPLHPQVHTLLRNPRALLDTRPAPVAHAEGQSPVDQHIRSELMNQNETVHPYRFTNHEDYEPQETLYSSAMQLSSSVTPCIFHDPQQACDEILTSITIINSILLDYGSTPIPGTTDLSGWSISFTVDRTEDTISEAVIGPIISQLHHALSQRPGTEQQSQQLAQYQHNMQSAIAYLKQHYASPEAAPSAPAAELWETAYTSTPTAPAPAPRAIVAPSVPAAYSQPPTSSLAPPSYSEVSGMVFLGIDWYHCYRPVPRNTAYPQSIISLHFDLDTAIIARLEIEILLIFNHIYTTHHEKTKKEQAFERIKYTIEELSPPYPNPRFKEPRVGFISQNTWDELTGQGYTGVPETTKHNKTQTLIQKILDNRLKHLRNGQSHPYKTWESYTQHRARMEAAAEERAQRAQRDELNSRHHVTITQRVRYIWRQLITCGNDIWPPHLS